MDAAKIYAQVHRLRERVAISVGGGVTVYLDARDARKLARAIRVCAKSCERESFVDSTCGTHEFHFDGAN